MDSKQNYIDKLEAEYKKIEAEMESKMADAKIKAQEEYENWVNKKSVWLAQYQDLKNSAEDQWESFKDVVDAKWHDAKLAFDRLRMKMR
jgi:ElaB/YqjD/DUF883 family membrane-anchored ribosome-binding protein